MAPRLKNVDLILVIFEAKGWHFAFLETSKSRILGLCEYATCLLSYWTLYFTTLNQTSSCYWDSLWRRKYGHTCIIAVQPGHKTCIAARTVTKNKKGDSDTESVHVVGLVSSILWLWISDRFDLNEGAQNHGRRTKHHSFALLTSQWPCTFICQHLSRIPSLFMFYNGIWRNC